MSGFNELTIRPARPSDAGVFRDLVLYASPEYEDFFEDKALPMMEFLFSRGGNLFSHEHASIAERDGEPAGLILGYGSDARSGQELNTAMLMWSRAFGEIVKNLPALLLNGGRVGLVNRGEYYISHLVVYPERRSGGVGAGLIGAFEDEARKKGLKKTVLETGSGNHQAIKFYRRAGYEEEKEISIEFKGKRKTYLRMSKVL